MSVFSSTGKTYDDHGRLLRHTPVSVRGGGALLINDGGDETTNDSYRIIVSDDENIQLQKRVSEVWNSTELEVSPATLLLGHDLSISAIGENLEIQNAQGDKRFLVQDIPFDLITGSQFPRTTLSGSRVSDFVIQSDFSNDSTNSAVSFAIVVDDFQGFVYGMSMKTGSVGSSAELNIIITEGVVPGGTLFFDRNYPATELPANSDVFIDFKSRVGFLLNEDLLVTITSDNDFSLLGLSSNNPFLNLDFQPFVFEQVVMESFVVDNNLDVLLDNNHDPIYINPVFI